MQMDSTLKVASISALFLLPELKWKGVGQRRELACLFPFHKGLQPLVES